MSCGGCEPIEWSTLNSVCAIYRNRMNILENHLHFTVENPFTRNENSLRVLQRRPFHRIQLAKWPRDKQKFCCDTDGPHCAYDRSFSSHSTFHIKMYLIFVWIYCIHRFVSHRHCHNLVFTSLREKMETIAQSSKSPRLSFTRPRKVDALTFLAFGN